MRAPNFTSTPLPFLIKDVLKIDLSGTFGDALSMFGQNFKSIMIHGISQPANGRSKGEKQCQNYIVDDGTGSIRVKFNHGTYQKGSNSMALPISIYQSSNFHHLQAFFDKLRFYAATMSWRRRKVSHVLAKIGYRRNRKSANRFYVTWKLY